MTDRAIQCHWEGDLILGLNSSAIGSLAERATRFTMLLHLPRMAQHGVDARVNNGPALAGHGAEDRPSVVSRYSATSPWRTGVSRTRLLQTFPGRQRRAE